MLTLQIPETDFYDEKSNMFITVHAQTLQLEHSLVSISKWEAKWKKPFLSLKEKTEQETLDYIRFMTITQNVNPICYTVLTRAQIEQVNNYIADPMTATTIKQTEDGKRGSGGIGKDITSEEIYGYMVSYRIPFECQKWHFNRLMMLIRVCGELNAPKKKMSRDAIARQNRSLNAARRARHHTHG